MNEFPLCGCEEYKKYLAEQALGALLAFSWLCKNEYSMKEAIGPNHAEYTSPILAEIKKDSKINQKLCVEKMNEYIQEENTMYDFITVSCRGFTGSLVKLEETISADVCFSYTISIREPKKYVTHTLESVKPSEIKLCSGSVTLGE